MVIRSFLDRLRGERRPPTGPLTTAEESEAEVLRQETLAKDEKVSEQGLDE